MKAGQGEVTFRLDSAAQALQHSAVLIDRDHTCRRLKPGVIARAGPFEQSLPGGNLTLGQFTRRFGAVTQQVGLGESNRFVYHLAALWHDAIKRRTNISRIGHGLVTDFLARHFETFLVKPLGLDRHPELRDMYFGAYERLLFLAQTEDAGLTEKAREAAEFLGLAFERKFTGYGDLSPALQRADTMLEPPNS